MKAMQLSLVAAALMGSAGAAQAESFDATIPSTGADEVEIGIVVTAHVPDLDGQYPVVLHSHGWGGSRISSVNGTVQKFLDAGFAVVSIDQRGHGASGGQANVEDPEFEGQDVMAVVDWVSGQPWTQMEDAEGSVTTNDPLLFSIGASYGGGYQWAGMLSEMTQRYDGKTRFDAIAPEITWYDLPDSLAPNLVARSVYLSGLYGLKTATGPQRLADYIHTSYAYTMATGNVPDGTVPGFVDLVGEFRQHGPSGYGLDGQVEVPALMRQGMTDILFNTNEGYDNFSKMLSNKARDKSLFIGYNGGHTALSPMGLPRGSNPSGDPCSEQIMNGGNFTDLTIKFFQQVLAGNNPRNEIVGNNAPNVYVATDTNTCVASNSLTDGLVSYPVETINVQVGSGVGSPTMAGVPIYTPIAGTQGLTFAGIGHLKGTAYAAVAEARAFVGLAKGTSESDAVLIQNAVMPMRFALPAAGEPFDLELAGMAVALAPDEQLYLVVSAINDQFIAHGSRTPGGIVIEGASIELPVR